MRIGIVHLNLMKRGGGDFVCVNFIKALKEENDITLLTGKKPNFKELNKAFGVKISKKDLDIKKIPFPGFLFSFKRLALWRKAVFKRSAYEWLKSHHENFDLLVSTQNEFPFPEPGVQYIHFPLKKREGVKYDSFIYRAYMKVFFSLLHNLSDSEISKNLTICNSKWTKEKYQECYSGEAEVITPPVKNDFPEVPFGEKKDGFVCVGKLTPEKRQDLAIKIIDRLQEKGFDVHLHILGGKSHPKYSRKIIEMAGERDYIIYEGFVSRKKLTEIVANHKFGIHCMKNEHYGIAPAELVRAGCITFVHNSGGQKYIVNQNKNLVFDGFKDTVKKIEKMLKDEELKKKTLGKLKKIKPNTPEEFRNKIRKFIK